MAKGSGTTKRGSSSNPRGLVRSTNGIPASERDATNGWLGMVDRANTIEKLNSISRTVQKIFNQGEVSYASTKAIVDAVEKRKYTLRKNAI